MTAWNWEISPCRRGERSNRGGTANPVDSSGHVRNGTSYSDIEEFKEVMMTDANRDRFIRCFISKLPTCANGAEPTEAHFTEIDQTLLKSAENEYRVVESSLFRGARAVVSFVVDLSKRD